MTDLAAAQAQAAPSDVALLARIALGLGLAYVLGLERELRGSPAGVRTFALVGAGATSITAITYLSASGRTVQGVITGIGFIGGGVVFHREGGMVRGMPTAATIFAVAALGVIVGYGHLWMATVIAAALMVLLEAPHIPLLRRLDVRRMRDRLEHDPDFLGDQSAGDNEPTPSPRRPRRAPSFAAFQPQARGDGRAPESTGYETD
jgi:putative Mg2+ transporter-C (MgtC) family protein